MSPDLDGRVIAIAGAGGGLGPIVAQRLADAGASLSLADRHQETADQVAKDLTLPADRVDPHAVDLLDESAANAWAAATEKKFGHIDGLLHLVGGYRGGDPIHSFDLADYEFLHGLLVRTLQFASRAFHPALSSSRHGRFVLVSSAAAQRPENTNAAYASAKAAAEAWPPSLADSFDVTQAAADACARPPADSFDGPKAVSNIIIVNAIETPAIREESPETELPTFTPA